jgi:hypothetical protein
VAVAVASIVAVTVEVQFEECENVAIVFIVHTAIEVLELLN